MLGIFIFISITELLGQESQAFNMTRLNDYLPGNSNKSSLEEVRLKGTTLYRANLIHLAYNFPIFMNITDGLIQDFYVSFPSFFSHDVLYKQLIDLYGMPKYVKDGSNALYTWSNEFEHVYVSTCTLTCFSLFYAVFKKDYSLKPFFLQVRTLPLDFLL